MSLHRLWKAALFVLVVSWAGHPALASHFRGGNVAVQVSPAGGATFTYETLWRKGSAFFPFDGIAQINFYNATDTARSSALRVVTPNIGGTTVFRDVSDPAFDFRRQVVTVDLAALGLAQGRYVARWQNCCRISGIANAPEADFSLETLVIYDGTANGSPILNSRILTVVGKGIPYGQNLNAFDPDGKPLTYQFLLGSARPTYGPSSQTPGITLDGAGRVAIPAESTAILRDINPRNPAGDYVFKVRVSDADGSYAERDVLLDVVATANRPPDVAPIGNRVIRIGESLVLPISATDPNLLDRVTLRTSDLPPNFVFVNTPGNPASATLAFRPSASQVGTFGINVEARDNGAPILTDSELVTVTVLDPNNRCPVLAPIGNRDAMPGVPFSFTISGADPDAGQTLTFSASFLPSGATFDPASRTFSWTPGAADVGVRLGTVFEVRDSAAPPCTDRESVGFSVQPANRFPVLAPIGDRAAAEGATIAFSVSAVDPEGDALVLAAAPLPVGATFDPATGRFSWRPAIGQAGIYELNFTATDNGAPQLTDSEAIRISVARSGQEAIRFAGLAEGQKVAGTILVEAQVGLAFSAVSVGFAIDGTVVNVDASAPFFLGAEANGLPAGFDTLALADGDHVLTAAVVDSSGATTIAERRFRSCNHVPPEITRVDGIFEGAVVSGKVEVEAHPIDDQQVASVGFAIDGTAVNTAPVAPYFLNGSRIAQGTFDVSCSVCLRVGDSNGDLVIVALDEDGTLARLCAAGGLFPSAPRTGIAANAERGIGNASGDDIPPSREHVCDIYTGQAFGLCNAFCEAQDCDAPGKKNDTSCNQIRDNFARLTGIPRLPCEAGGNCIHELVLGLVRNPNQLASFGPDDFTGEVTTFELPFSVPLGYDTRQLADGAHTLAITATDNQGLTRTVEIRFFVRNIAPPADALRVTLSSPTPGASFEADRLVPVAATVAQEQGPVEVRFYADGALLATDAAAPYEAIYHAPAVTSGRTVTLLAVASDSRGPRQSSPVAIGIVRRQVPGEPIEVLGFSADASDEGRVAIDSPLHVTFSREVDPASLFGAVRIERNGLGVPLGVAVEADGLSATIETGAPLLPDALYSLIVDGALAVDGVAAPRFAGRFLTFPDVARVVGVVEDSNEEPLAGIRVRLGDTTVTTDDRGIFRFADAPRGLQLIHTDAATIGGRTFPAMALQIQIEAGLRVNQFRGPIYLPTLDLAGGLDVVAGRAMGGGILTSSKLAGISIDLRNSFITNLDGTPYTGRMSISPVEDENVPMPSPTGVYSSSFVTVQPPVFLNPRAPITYPNLDGGLPGEQMPLWHFDHVLFRWRNYATGTVSADGTLIVSNPGEGIDETGWGTPQPPMTFTDVTGTVVDNERSPLHGTIVSIGNITDATKQDGSFTLRQVPAGRQGQPIQIAALVTARDIEINHYKAFSRLVTAVQNGTTALGEVPIPTYGPVVNGKLRLHGDFEPTVGQDHVLKVGSSHESERRYQREVEELRLRLNALGFRQGGSAANHGQELALTGAFDEMNLKKAVRLFQSIELSNGNDGTLGGDGIFGRMSLERLNLIYGIVPRIWDDIGASGGIDYGCPNEPADGYGTPDLGNILGQVATVAGNDASNPSGGDHPDHASHETGIDIDVSLPRTDNGGCAASRGYGMTTVTQSTYDRAAMRTTLQALIDTGATTRRWLNDTTLQGEMYNGQALCSPMGGHDNHLHFRINPSLVPDGARFGFLTPRRLRLLAGGPQIRAVLSPGAGEEDAAVDGTLRIELQPAFDPSTLNAATVVIEGPAAVPVQGEVVADDSGKSVFFTPVVPLSFGTDYAAVVTSGAVLADGTLLAQPLRRTFRTESGSSLRLAQIAPTETAVRVPLNSEVVATFDGDLDPATLDAARVRLVRDGSGASVPASLSLSGGRVLTVKPAAPLAELATYNLLLGPGIRGTDGSPLVAADFATSFSTGLTPGLSRVEVAPAEIEITRADLSDRSLAVTGFFPDGSSRNLTSPIAGGTDYLADRNGVILVDTDGVLQPIGNGDVLIDVDPALPGYRATSRVKVVGVFPEVVFVSPQFGQGAADDVVVRFSERVDTADVSIGDVQVRDAAGDLMPGVWTIETDGVTLTFNPAGLLPLRTDYRLTYRLDLRDGRGILRSFSRKLNFATASANLGFELGDLSGFETTGDVSVITTLGPLHAPEGSFMAELITSDQSVGGRVSTLKVIDLIIPEGATTLRFTYNFLTDEFEQGAPFNDFFRATLVLPDGTVQTIVNVSRDTLGSSQISPVPGFDRMTGFRTASIAVRRMPGVPCHLVLESMVSDAGDASIDSAVLIDDIRFQ